MPYRTQSARAYIVAALIFLWPATPARKTVVSARPLSLQDQPTAGASGTRYLRDNSDWWSMLRSADSDQGIPLQEREPPPGNLRILGIDLVKEGQTSQVPSKLGAATTVQRGDAATSRAQMCYACEPDRGDVHLVFEEGEVSKSYYLFEDGPHWNGESYCASSKAVSADLKNEAGLGLGETRAQVTALLGKPSLDRPDRLVYVFSLRKKTPAAEFEASRQTHPELSESELEENFGYYDLWIEIDVRFHGSKSSYIGILWSATY